MVKEKVITMNTKGEIVKHYPMNPRHKIDDKYNNDPRHIRQWEMTIEWLNQFIVNGDCVDCGDRTELTDRIESLFKIKVKNTDHDLNEFILTHQKYNNFFAFEVVEHLLNPLVFLKWINFRLEDTGYVYLSTPINRPNWMRNKELHFHEFNYNELMHLIDVSGFKVVDEKVINPSVKWWTGFRPVLRKFFGCGNNILLRLKRK